MEQPGPPGPYVVFLQQSGRYPSVNQPDVTSKDRFLSSRQRYQEIVNKASCLSLVSNAILYWKIRSRLPRPWSVSGHKARTSPMKRYRTSLCCRSGMSYRMARWKSCFYGSPPACLLSLLAGQSVGIHRGFAEELKKQPGEPRGAGEESGQTGSLVRAVVSVVRRLFFDLRPSAALPRSDGFR